MQQQCCSTPTTQTFSHTAIERAAPAAVLQAGGCQLNLLGWCCFGALVCTAFPLSWLPFICSSCKKHYQRPVYGYPMSSMSFIASDAVASGAAKPAASSAVAAPTILCMDATLEMQSLPQHDQQQEPVMQQSQPQPQQQPEPQLQQLCASPRANFLPCSPSPPPMSIFVPPSLVPASKHQLDCHHRLRVLRLCGACPSSSTSSCL